MWPMVRSGLVEGVSNPENSAPASGAAAAGESESFHRPVPGAVADAGRGTGPESAAGEGEEEVGGIAGLTPPA